MLTAATMMERHSETGLAGAAGAATQVSSRREHKGTRSLPVMQDLTSGLTMRHHLVQLEQALSGNAGQIAQDRSATESEMASSLERNRLPRKFARRSFAPIAMVAGSRRKGRSNERRLSSDLSNLGDDLAPSAAFAWNSAMTNTGATAPIAD
jgi:hypothetical protein